MCGIVGYSSKQGSAAEVLLHGLMTLEYRGYDSSGAAFSKKEGVTILKCEGKVARLQERLKETPIDAPQGIAHTRWATHGAPTSQNAHPHRQGSVTLVHNGIIENYAALKSELSEQGYHFHSQTDSEAACALIDAYYQRDKDPLLALRKAQQRLQGSYAFAVIFDEDADSIYAMRKDSPLIAAKGENAAYLASDLPALLAYTKTYFVLPEGDILHLKQGSLSLYDANGQTYQPHYQTSTLDVRAIQKEGYAHFMLKEIHEEPRAIQATLRSFENDGVLANCKRPFALERYRRIFIVACGSAYHAGMIAKELIESEARIETQVEVASEFRYRRPLFTADSLVILISQSGETADTLAAARLANAQGIDTLAIVNVVGSSLAREADYVAYTMAGVEIAVATTKAYAAQVALLAAFALRLASIHGKMPKARADRIHNQLQTLPVLFERLLAQEDWEKHAALLADHTHVFFIGRGLDHAVCLEGSLKLKEISYIHSEAYAAGELKHGTISLIEQGTPVIALASEAALFDKCVSNIREVKARGAHVLLLCREDFRVYPQLYDTLIALPPLDRMVQAILTVLPLQMIAYHTACLRGCEIDQPRNLAKSVTVE